MPLPDDLAAQRDRLARRIVRESNLLRHHLPAGHYLFGPDESDCEIRVDTYHDELGRLLAVGEGDHVSIVVPGREQMFAVLTHADGETYGYAVDCNADPHDVVTYQHGQAVKHVAAGPGVGGQG
jgi:hypothetical protein